MQSDRESLRPAAVLSPRNGRRFAFRTVMRGGGWSEPRPTSPGLPYLSPVQSRKAAKVVGRSKRHTQAARRTWQHDIATYAKMALR